MIRQHIIIFAHSVWLSHCRFGWRQQLCEPTPFSMTQSKMKKDEKVWLRPSDILVSANLLELEKYYVILPYTFPSFFGHCSPNCFPRSYKQPELYIISWRYATRYLCESDVVIETRYAIRVRKKSHNCTRKPLLFWWNYVGEPNSDGQMNGSVFSINFVRLNSFTKTIWR